MRLSLRRQFRLLQAYVALSFCALVFLTVAAFGQAPVPQKIDELTVHPDGAATIEFLDADGKTVQRIPSK